ncbi:hypothetical protein ACVGVM_10305 [Pseudonocardia bannensis]|uniref:Uncharacterized protein n=1 Tax=Pseudonocardia bannensis TaxID=630973 RepID=A0A848DHU2_9PSEU|nr:hypothetical protein [Pseudonocardia bannensis]NMH92054.1 hypothetical protein [Pseudonocardia bannensis]
MGDEDHRTLDEHERQQTRGQQPGGRSSRGPAVDPGGEPRPRGPVPPYEGRTGGNGPRPGAAAEGGTKAFDADNAGSPGPPPPVSEEERTGMSATETEPEPRFGVGESTGKRAEDLAPDREDVERKDSSDRPAGLADPDADAEDRGAGRA